MSRNESHTTEIGRSWPTTKSRAGLRVVPAALGLEAERLALEGVGVGRAPLAVPRHGEVHEAPLDREAEVDLARPLEQVAEAAERGRVRAPDRRLDPRLEGVALAAAQELQHLEARRLVAPAEVGPEVLVGPPPRPPQVPERREVDLDLREDGRRAAVGEAHREEGVPVAVEAGPAEAVLEAHDAVAVAVAPHHRPQHAAERRPVARRERPPRAVPQEPRLPAVLAPHLVARPPEALAAAALVRARETAARLLRDALAERVERAARRPRAVQHDLELHGVIGPEPLVVVLVVQHLALQQLARGALEDLPRLDQGLQLLEELKGLRRRLAPQRPHGPHAARHADPTTTKSEGLAYMRITMARQALGGQPAPSVHERAAPGSARELRAAAAWPGISSST